MIARGAIATATVAGLTVACATVVGVVVAGTIVAALPTAATAVSTAHAESTGAVDSPRARIEHDYLLSCAGCHRFDGSGSKGVPSLYETARLAALPGGREYLASVPGAAQAPLDDERLAAVLNWILFEFGGADDIAHAIPPYDADEVAALRSRPLRAPRSERQRITGETQ